MKQVLLVEDDRWLADSYRHVIEKAGWEVVVTHSGDEAMRSIEAAIPAVVIADMLLEGHTVLGLLHELQSYEDTAEIPIIVCTSLSHPKLEAEHLHSYHVRVVLDKATLTPEQLVATIREVTE